MMSFHRPVLVATVVVAALVLGACAETKLAIYAAKEFHEYADGPDDLGTYKVGDPYQVAGVWYYPAVDPDYDEVGIASWYGEAFHGKDTANGAVYDMNALTAAHKTLPMPSRVRVTNLENGRSLVLTINDRGPFVDTRIIDVSRRGAQLLGFHRKGTTKVRVEIIGGEGDIVSGATTVAVAQGDAFYVQAGAFADVNNAHHTAAGLSGLGEIEVTKITVNGVAIHRVRLGPFATLDSAAATLDQVVLYGHPDAHIVAD